MAPPKEIATVIYHNGHIVDNPVQGSVYTCANPIFIYVSHSITLTQLIRKINNRLSTRATAKVAQLLFHVPISFHQGQTHYISTQLLDNDDLRGAMETIVQNPQLNFAKFYVVTDLIPQPQLSCPQLQLPPPQQLPYNNLNLNDLVSSYNNLEIQDTFDIYTHYTQLLSKNDSFFDAQQTSFDKQNHPSSPFRSPSQQPQTQTSNRNEHLIANEDPIIQFHEENMDDFSEDEDQQFFDHINHQSDDQSNDESVGRLMIPPSPPLQYHQPRCPFDLNFDHLPHYIDQDHFVQQQHNVQPPIGALEVGMAFDEKAQCIQVVKEYNTINHFDCRIIYSDQRRLNFMCK
ncbi:hypothetical protein HKD37_16G045498 [Glycine soja]